MRSTELDEIPKDWRVESLDFIADFLNGLALQKYPPENEKEFLPVIKIRELKSGITDNTDKANKDIPSQYILIDHLDVVKVMRFWEICHLGKGDYSQLKNQ